MSRPRILISIPVRQSSEVFSLYLESLRGLDTTGLDVHRSFVLHNCPDLAAMLSDDESYTLHESPEPDVRADDTHHWDAANLNEIVWMKNQIAERAVSEGYDAVFMADSDLVLHPKTLQALWGANKDIVAEAFWTSWQPGETKRPNAWHYDSYTILDGHMEKWMRPGLYPVGMTGACILIKSKVYDSGVTYDALPNVSWWGEDRHFCIRAAAHGFDIWLDTHHPAMHLYRSADVEAYSRPRKIVGALLARNEAGRYLERVLEQMRAVCDEVVVLDDASTDETPNICAAFGARVIHEEPSRWESDESSLRHQLWNMATDFAADGGWVLCLDADETIEPTDLDQLRQLLPLAEYNGADGISFRLHDMWSSTHYRDDELWSGHRRNWTMLVRVSEHTEYWWADKRLHGGRLPRNAGVSVYDSGLRIQHWGWSRPEDRQEKYERYMRIDPDGKEGSLAQYRSILDESPRLARWR